MPTAPVVVGTQSSAATVSTSAWAYNPTTGVVTLTLTSPLNLLPGAALTISGATGTGSFASINGSQTAGVGTTGSTVTYTIATGLTMTITGATVASTSTGVALTGPVPAGSYLIIAASSTANTPKTAADTQGNFYRVTEECDTTSFLNNCTFYAYIASALSAGQEVNVTFSASGGNKGLIALYITGVPFAGLDLHGAPAQGTGTAVSVSSISPSQPIEIALAFLFAAGGSGDTLTEDPLWLDAADNTVSGSTQHIAYRFTNTTAALTYGPSFQSSVAWAAKIQTFRALLPSYSYAMSPAGNGPMGAVPPVVFPAWGIFANDAGQVPLGLSLGAKVQRVGCNVNQAPSGYPVSTCQSLRAQGFSIQLELHNNTGANNGPPANIATFQAQCASAISLCLVPGDFINVENEVSDQSFWVGTAAQYLQELAAAAQVAHSLGFKITNDGMAAGAFYRLYWYWLWTTGQVAKADAFAQMALIPQASSSGVDYTTDIPSAQYPSTPIFGNHPSALTNAQFGLALFQGYQNGAAGIDWLNNHLYWWSPDNSPVVDALSWASEFTGLPLTCNEIGQLNSSTVVATVPNAMGVAVRFAMPYHIWFTPQSAPGSQPLGDASGNLYANGMAWQAFAAAN